MGRRRRNRLQVGSYENQDGAKHAAPGSTVRAKIPWGYGESRSDIRPCLVLQNDSSRAIVMGIFSSQTAHEKADSILVGTEHGMDYPSVICPTNVATIPSAHILHQMGAVHRDMVHEALLILRRNIQLDSGPPTKRRKKYFPRGTMVDINHAGEVVHGLVLTADQYDNRNHNQRIMLLIDEKEQKSGSSCLSIHSESETGDAGVIVLGHVGRFKTRHATIVGSIEEGLMAEVDDHLDGLFPAKSA